MRIGIKLTALVIGVMIGAMTGAAPALAQVTNTGVGYLGASDPNLGDGSITLTPQTLSVVKRAFTSAGGAIAGGSTVAVGTTIKFMLYINNKTDSTLSDVSLRDVLAANYLYQAGTIKVVNPGTACALLACTGAEESTMFGLADAAAALTDGVNADTASIAGATVDIGNQFVANGQLDVTAQSRLAVLLTVLVQ